VAHDIVEELEALITFALSKSHKAVIGGERGSENVCGLEARKHPGPAGDSGHKTANNLASVGLSQLRGLLSYSNMLSIACVVGHAAP
jgi:hypothetical protein